MRFLTVLLLTGLSLTAWAQGRTVTGKVTSSDDGSGLPGVNVVEKGTTNGSITDAEGAFSVTVQEGATLVFSFVGYKTSEIAVGAQSTVNVVLDADVTALSEVVVVGYGEINKKDATSAIASIKSEDFNRGIIASPEQLIQGRTAGVQITSSSGEPGAGVNVRIRGTSSVRGGNDPLFVVDGIPLSGGATAAGGQDFGRGMSSAKNPLNFINPNDIESIDILKDASATAIYGSRGANGVVIITTKSGKGKKHTFEYGTTISISAQARKYDLLDANEYIAAYGALGGDVAFQNKGFNTDWQDQINRTATSQNHNVSYGTSYAHGDVRASLAYDDQVGIIKNSGMERLNARLNINQSFFKDRVDFGAQMLFSRVNDQAAPITNTAGFEGDLLGSAIMYNPTAAPDLQQIQGEVISNPLALLAYSQDKTRTNRRLLNYSLNFDITNDLAFKINTGFDRSSSTRDAAYSSRIRSMSGVVNRGGRAWIIDQTNDSDLLEMYLSYNKEFTNSKLSLVGGFSYQKFIYRQSVTQGAGFASTELQSMIDDLAASRYNIENFVPFESFQQYGYTNGQSLQVYTLYPTNQLYVYPQTSPELGTLPVIKTKAIIGSRAANNNELQSFFARANYSLNDKYLVMISYRRDGSTRFGKNNKYGSFPAASIAWRLSEEDFVPGFFDDLKLRVGVGITGNQEIPHNLHQLRYRWTALGIEENGNINQQGSVPVSPDYDDLKWEETTQINIGVDFAFYSGRLSGSLDYYNKNTTDLLMQSAYAQPAPDQFKWENLDANVINSGVELNLNGIVVDKDDFDFNVGFNVSYNKNIVKNYNRAPLPTGLINGQGLTNAFTQRIDNNQPIYSYYVRPFSGFGSDGLNKPEEDIQQYVGKSPIPKVSLGLSLSATYKNWDIMAFFNGQMGHYVYNNVTNAYFTKGSIAIGRNVTPDVVASSESVGNSPDVSERFLEKGDFLRLQNLSLGYAVPMVEKSLIKKLRISVTGQNVFLLTNYSGLDPEVNVDKQINGVPSLGIDYTAYPRARTLSIGLNATF